MSLIKLTALMGGFDEETRVQASEYAGFMAREVRGRAGTRQGVMTTNDEIAEEFQLLPAGTRAKDSSKAFTAQLQSHMSILVLICP